MSIAADKSLPGLPVTEITGRLNDMLREHGTVVVTAPPGAGKSTLLPITVMEGFCGPWCPGRVIMLEPRRLAARQVARRMASILGEQAGETVGYRVRFENRVSSRTKIEVVTEGILSRMLLDDPGLEGVSVVIFDEFHERSLASDEALSLVRNARDVLRPDLRIIIMSATIDTAAICSALDAPLVESRGRSFPVGLRYAERDTDRFTCVQDVSRAVLRAHRQDEGDILAFLPGEAEIRACAALLEGELGPTDIRPLYGMLSLEEQNLAIAPSPAGRRKVVLATPIAETSLTIEGVRIVVDCGLYKTLVYSPQTGQSHLETVPVSLDMADQRAGRAGRVSAGICYRLYTERTAMHLKETRTPEILEADLVPLALDLAVWGEPDASRLPWLTEPPRWKMSSARALLRSLGAVDDGGAVTPDGRRLSAFPCHPRLARMLSAASSDSRSSALATDLAAIMEARDPLSSESDGVDVDARVTALRAARKSGKPSRRWQPVIMAAEQFRRIVKAGEDNSAADWYEEGRLLALAYPERIGKLNPDGCAQFTLSTGDQVRIDGADALSFEEWIVAVSANVQQGVCGRVLLASRVRPEDLLPMADACDKLAWSPREGAVVARREWRIGTLAVNSIPVTDVPHDKVMEVLCDAAGKYGVSMFDFSDEVCNLQRRVAAVSSWHPELGFPDLSRQAVLDRAAEWLPVYAGKASSAAELRKINMKDVVWGFLDYEAQKAVERLAPTHITVPTGSSIRLEYRQGAEAPVLKVRLQECFGLVDTPRVDGGRLPVLMELLSPGYKPVQLTSDLASFWAGTYFEVRKELRRRYPKHSWPDNPLEAPAVRGVGRKLLALMFALLLCHAGGAETVEARKYKGDWAVYEAVSVSDINGFTPAVEPETDIYGGWKVARLKATGFFRVQKWKGRWWFVTPDGHPFISKAVTTVAPGTMSSTLQREKCLEVFGSREAWRDSTLALLRYNGFNSAGCWTEARYMKDCFPYALMVNGIKKYASRFRKDLPARERAKVVLDPAYAVWLDAEIGKIASEYRDDPWCMGYFVDNEIFWMEDTELFEKYLQLVRSLLRKHDPNHLYFGCRFNKWKQELSDERFFALAGKYMDVVSVNHYARWEPAPEVFDKWGEWSGRPVMVTEFYVKGEDSGLPNTSGAGWLVHTQRDRGLFYRNFVIHLLRSPFCIGWQWFKYIDNDPADTKADPSNLDANKGIVNSDFIPYVDMLDQMRDVNGAVWSLAEFFGRDFRTGRESGKGH